MVTDQEEWKPLFVGAVIGGSNAQNRAIRASVSTVARLVQDLEWFNQGDETGVDAVFHVPGHLQAPDYQGVRIGRYSKKERLIMVQIAVPPDLEDMPSEEIEKRLAQYLVEGANLASDALAARKGALPLRQAAELARRAMVALS